METEVQALTRMYHSKMDEADRQFRLLTARLKGRQLEAARELRSAAFVAGLLASETWHTPGYAYDQKRVNRSEKA